MVQKIIPGLTRCLPCCDTLARTRILRLIVICGFAGCGPGPVPDDLKELRTVLGEGFFARQQITLPTGPDGQAQLINDVRSTILPNGSTVLAVAGTFSTIYIDPISEMVESSVSNDCAWESLTDLDGDGRFELACEGLDCDVWLEDSSGQLLWEQTGSIEQLEDCPAAIATGDLDGDGQQEICIVYHVDSIECFNTTGDSLWRAGLDHSYDGGLIVESASETTEARVLATSYPFGAFAKQELEIRSADGGLIERRVMDPPVNLESFDWPASAGGPALRRYTEREVQVLSVSEEILFRFDPGEERDRIRFVGGTRVAFSENSTDVYVAICLGFAFEWNRDALLLFNSQGELVYRETIQAGVGIWAVANPSGPGQVLAASNGLGNLVIYRKAQ
ncbi:MAG: VCBS repeat-containing protein [Planctomycetota bacterium]